jgi:hypothetical protein
MSEQELPHNIRYVQITLEEILGSKVRIKDISNNKQVKNKQMFIDMLNAISQSSVNNFIAVNEVGIDLTGYTDPYMQAIDCLLNLTFNNKQIDIIYWWLFEKYLPSGDVLELVDQKTGNKIPTDTPSDIWDIIESIKTKPKQ